MARNFVTASSQYGIKSSGVYALAYTYTIACWVRPSSTTQSGTMVAFGDGTGLVDRATLQMNGTAVSPNTVFAMVTDGSLGGANVNGTTVYNTSSWYHVLGVWRSSTDRELFVNGVSDGTSITNVGTPGSLSRLYVGARLNSTVGQYVSGDVAEVAVWGIEVLADDIRGLASGVSPLQVRRGYLKHYIPLIGGTASTELDMMVSGGITMTNSPANSTSHPPIRRAL